MVTAVGAEGQEASLKQETSPKQAAVSARGKDGKKLFGAEDMLRIARVSAPRISPDGARAAYLVSAVTTGKEGEAAEKGGASGKFVSQLWVVPTAGPASATRQFTRGEKSVANAKWSPDGKILAFTKEGTEEQGCETPGVVFVRRWWRSVAGDETQIGSGRIRILAGRQDSAAGGDGSRERGAGKAEEG